jgi:hypothetical protein
VEREKRLSYKDAMKFRPFCAKHPMEKIEMSSIQSLISGIEEDYRKVLGMFESCVIEDKYYRFKEITEDYLLGLLREVMGFQRRIEEALASVQGIAEKTGYSKRLDTIAEDIFVRLETEKKIDTVLFRYYEDTNYGNQTVTQDFAGVIKELKSSCHNFLHGDNLKYRRGCFVAYFGFKSLQSSLIELEEELRHIGALTTYPIEKQVRLKQELVVNGFEEVAVSLEEAESNVEIDHFKDCVSRCRDAIEIFVAFVREKETGEKTDKHFATDLAKIGKVGVFDEGTQKLAQGVYSFTSLKGSHKYDASKVTVYDAETAMKESYSLLEMLLRRYVELTKSKKGA